MSWHVQIRQAILTLLFFISFPFATPPQIKMHHHLPVTATPQCPCTVRTGHSKTDCFISRGEKDDLALLCLCAAPPSGSPPPLHRVPYQNEHFACQRYWWVYCETSDSVAYLWKPFKTRVFRFSRITIRPFCFVASDPCCTDSPTAIFPDWYAFHIILKNCQELYIPSYLTFKTCTC